MPEANPPAEFDDNQGQVVESANPPEPGSSSGEVKASETPEQIPAEDLDTEDFDYSVFEKSIPGEVIAESAAKPPTSPEAPPQAAAPAVTPAPGETPPQVATPPQPPEQPGVPPQADAQPATTEAKPPAEPAQAPAGEAQDGFTALDNAIQASRDKVIQTVAEQTYKLSQDELNAIQEEPERVIPQLLARVHVNAVQGVIRHVAQQMPAVVGAIMQAREQTSKLESDFFKAWPQLDKAKHGADIMKVGQVFRQLNPNATFNEFVRHVGAQVVLTHGLHLQQATQQQQAPAARPQAQPAFQPAGIGRSSAPAAPSQPKNVWEEMVEIMNE